MTINAAALDLIKEAEGWVNHWYLDPAGVYTVCYGHTDRAGAPFHSATKDRSFSQAEGEAILQDDLLGAEASVLSLVKVPLNENQYGALVSFTYNLGAGNLSSSTLLKKLNAGNYHGAAAEFAKWTLAGGKSLPGLVRRRAAEASLFLAPVKNAAPAPVSVPAIPVHEAPKPVSPWQRVKSFAFSLFGR